MPFVYRILADCVVVVHAAYVLFVILGFLATVVGAFCGWSWTRRPGFRVAHLAAILIVVAEAWGGIVCPLTDWEHALRERSGATTYRGAFIANLVHEWLYYDAPPWVFTAAYTVFGGLVVAAWIWAPPQWRKSAETESPPTPPPAS